MFRLKNGVKCGARVVATIWIMGGVVATILMSCVFRRAFGCQNQALFIICFIASEKIPKNMFANSQNKEV